MNRKIPPLTGINAINFINNINTPKIYTPTKQEIDIYKAMKNKTFNPFREERTATNTG